MRIVGLLLLFAVIWKAADVRADLEFLEDYAAAVQGPNRSEVVRCMRDTADGSIVCDCGGEEFATLPSLRVGEHFRIRNCPHLHIPSATFSQATLIRSVHLTDIAHLTLEPDSLHFQPPRYNPQQPHPRGIVVVLRNVRLPELPSHALRGNIEQLLIDACHIEAVRAFAVGPTHDMLSLTVQHSTVGRLERHVLKKFAVAHLSVENCTFGEAVPSGAVREVTVTERLRIVGSRFGEVLPNAFQFEAVRSFDLLNNRFETLNGSSFHMTIADRLTVSGNNFTELSSTTFLAITSTFPTRPQASLNFQPPEFHFADNRLHNIVPLDFRLRFTADAFNLRLQHLILDQPITCTALDAQATDFHSTHADALYMRTCTICPWHSYRFLHERQCRSDRTLGYVVGGVSAMVVLLVLTVMVVWWLYRRRQEAVRRMQVVQPEPRTYRETQIVIQIENAGLLKTDL